jgi:hypothetical protein
MERSVCLARDPAVTHSIEWKRTNRATSEHARGPYLPLAIVVVVAEASTSARTGTARERASVAEYTRWFG